MKFFCLLMFATQFLFAQDPGEATTTPKSNSYKFDLQGHRGARGLAPENSLQGFRKALEIGVNTLELDVVITKDRHVIVSHEPWMNPSICLDARGNALDKTEERPYNIYQMTYDEVKAFDCGSVYYDAFPEQVLESTNKPLLKEVFAMADSLSRNHGRNIQFNIEIKSNPEGDNLFHPTPEVFTDLVMEVLQQEINIDRVNLQSFDFRVLKYLNRKYPEVKLAALVYQSDFRTALKELGFTPEIYSPYYPLVTQDLVREVHALEMKIIPWTVNDPEMILTLLKYGVDGIITDYPNRASIFRK